MRCSTAVPLLLLLVLLLEDYAFMLSRSATSASRHQAYPHPALSLLYAIIVKTEAV